MDQVRILGAKTTIVTLCISGLLAGLGAWLYVDFREEPDSCRQLARHERVSAALGTGNVHDSSCAELGLAIKQATTGQADGERSLAQAQAMKDVLVAIDGVIGKTWPRWIRG